MNRWIEILLTWLASRDNTRHPYPTTFFGARLQSSLPEACFQARFHVDWPPTGGDPSLEIRSYAERQLRRTAQRTARAHSLLDIDEAQTAINLALQQDLPLAVANVRLISAEAVLSVLPADRELAEQYEKLQRDTALTRETQRAELDRLRLMGDQILADPALARLWWLDGKREKLPQLVQMDGIFEQTALLITQCTEPVEQANPIPGLIRTFLHDLAPHHRALLIKQLQGVFVAYERDDLAGMLGTHDQPPTPCPHNDG